MRLIDLRPGTAFRLWRDRSGMKDWTFEAGDSCTKGQANAHLVSGGKWPEQEAGDEFWFSRNRRVVPFA